MTRSLVTIVVAAAGVGLLAQQGPRAPCDQGNGGLTLPPGFCASLVADNLGRARHMTLSPAGDLYVVRRAPDDGPRARPAGQPALPPVDAVVALHDSDGDGRFDRQAHFGPGLNGTGIGWRGDYLYVGSNTQLARFRMTAGALVPSSGPEIIVTGLPLSLPHSTKPFAFGEHGEVYVQVGSPSNACQEPDETAGAPGQQPCRQLDLQGGIWKYDANIVGQTHNAGHRFATGLRHTVGLTWNPTVHGLFAVQNGRDQLDTLWPSLYTPQQNATTVAEEMQRIGEGSNQGWPYCYYDLPLKKRVLAPEYGGDGKKVGDCAKYDEPVAVFPAHSAPLDLMFYTGTQFPHEYRNGAFVTFHGSLNRALVEQHGFDVRFVPFAGGKASGESRVFASGFAGPMTGASAAPQYRPVGLAQSRDGAIYVSDDVKGRIWKISYAKP